MAVASSYGEAGESLFVGIGLSEAMKVLWNVGSCTTLGRYKMH